MIYTKRIFTFIIILFSMLIGACKTNTPALSTATRNSYKLKNVTFSLAQPEAWSASAKTTSHISFSYAQPMKGVSSNLVIDVLITPRTIAPESMLRSMEDSVRKEFTRFRWLSRHYNRMEYKGQHGMEYDGIYKDTTSAESSARFILYRGIILQNSNNPAQLSHVRLEYFAPDKAIPNGVLSDYQNLIESLRFE